MFHSFLLLLCFTSPKIFMSSKLHIEKVFTILNSSLNFPAFILLQFILFSLHKRLELNCSNSELLLVAVTENLNKFSVYCSDLCLQFVTLRMSLGTSTCWRNKLKTLHKIPSVHSFIHSSSLFYKIALKLFNFNRHMKFRKFSFPSLASKGNVINGAFLHVVGSCDELRVFVGLQNIKI